MDEEEQLALQWSKVRPKGGTGSAFGPTSITTTTNIITQTRPQTQAGTGGSVHVKLPKARLTLDVDLGSVDAVAALRSRLDDWAMVPVSALAAQRSAVQYVTMPQLLEVAQPYLQRQYYAAPHHHHHHAPSVEGTLDKMLAVLALVAEKKLAEYLMTSASPPVPTVDPCQKQNQALKDGGDALNSAAADPEVDAATLKQTMKNVASLLSAAIPPPPPPPCSQANQAVKQ